MDPIEKAIILQEAKSYTDSKQLGRRVKKTFAWDGDSTGKTVVKNEVGSNCKISDDLVDALAAKLVKLYITMRSTNQQILFLVDTNLIEIRDGLPTLWAFDAGGGLGAVLNIVYQEVEGFPKGVYVGYGEDWYVSYVEFETIHPIDPKFIPGVKINLLDYGIDIFEFFLQGGGKVEADMGAIFDLIKSDIDAPVTFVLTDKAGTLKVETQATKTWQNGNFNGLSAMIVTALGGSTNTAYLLVSHTQARLIVKAVE